MTLSHDSTALFLILCCSWLQTSDVQTGANEPFEKVMMYLSVQLPEKHLTKQTNHMLVNRVWSGMRNDIRKALGRSFLICYVLWSYKMKYWFLFSTSFLFANIINELYLRGKNSRSIPVFNTVIKIQFQRTYSLIGGHRAEALWNQTSTEWWSWGNGSPWTLP